MAHPGPNLLFLLKWLAIALVFQAVPLVGSDAAVQIQIRHEPLKLSPGLSAPTQTKPRIVPADPFLTNLLMRPMIHYGGLGFEATRHPASTFGRLFRWNEEGGFRVVSKNYSSDTSSGSSRGFSFFRADFP